MPSLLDVANSNEDLPKPRISNKFVLSKLGYRQTEVLMFCIRRVLETCPDITFVVSEARRYIDYVDHKNHTKGAIVFNCKTGGWKDVIKGRRFTEILVPDGEEWLDNDGRGLLSSRLIPDIPDYDTTYLRRLCMNAGRPQLLSDKDKLLAWGRFKLGDLMEGTLDYFKDIENPTEEEYKLAVFGTGGIYRPSTEN